MKYILMKLLPKKKKCLPHVSHYMECEGVGVPTNNQTKVLCVGVYGLEGEMEI